MLNKMLALARTDAEKPRHEGITSIIDKLQPIDIDNFKKIALFVDYVKIPESNLLLYSPLELERRIKFYHEHKVRVSVDSKCIKFAIVNNSFDELIRELLSFGFDVLEIDVEANIKKFKANKIQDIIKSHNCEFHWRLTDIGLCNRTVDNQIFEMIEDLLESDEHKIILDLKEGYNSKIIDININWNLISSLISRFSQRYFIFDTSNESQQIQLISRLGDRVNIGSLDIFQVALIEWTRRKYHSKLEIPSKENIISIGKDIIGGPSLKFIYFIIKFYQPIDQTNLMYITELPRRTIQASINLLKRQGIISEHADSNDARKKVYELVGNIRFPKDLYL